MVAGLPTLGTDAVVVAVVAARASYLILGVRYYRADGEESLLILVAGGPV